MVSAPVMDMDSCAGMENAINAPPVLNYVSLTNELGMAGVSVGTPVFRNSLISAENVTMASALSRNCQCPATNCLASSPFFSVFP